MKIKFLTSGESPVHGVGVFNTGDIRDIAADSAEVFVEQGIAEYVIENTGPEAEADKGVIENGN